MKRINKVLYYQIPRSSRRLNSAQNDENCWNCPNFIFEYPATSFFLEIRKKSITYLKSTYLKTTSEENAGSESFWQKIIIKRATLVYRRTSIDHIRPYRPKGYRPYLLSAGASRSRQIGNSAEPTWRGRSLSRQPWATNRRTVGISALLASQNSKKIFCDFYGQIYINALQNVHGSQS